MADCWAPFTLVVKKWYWSDVWPLLVAYSNPLRHIHGLVINFGITVWWCQSDNRQMWPPGIASWSRTIAHCMCKMVLIPQSLCSKVSQMACRDCGVCNPSPWVTVQFSVCNEGSSLCRTLQILEVAKHCTVYLFLPVPVITDYSEEDLFLLRFSSCLHDHANFYGMLC